MGKGGDNRESLLARKQAESEKIAKEKDEELLSDRVEKMSQAPGFYWDDKPEPHALRGKEIRAAHPDVTELIGHYDSMTVFKIVGLIALQLLSLLLLQDSAWYTRIFCCYTLSGTINHAMTLAMHEASHNLCAKKFFNNRVILILANLPMGIHQEHPFVDIIWNITSFKEKRESMLTCQQIGKEPSLQLRSAKLFGCFCNHSFTRFVPSSFHPNTFRDWKSLILQPVLLSM